MGTLNWTDLKVVVDPSPKQIADWEAGWTSFVEDLEIGRGGSDDWAWEKKGEMVDQSRSCRILAIVAGDAAQGLILVSWPTESRLQANVPVLYVEYLETAPWNRADIVRQHVLFKGIGKALLYLAIKESLIERFGGRISLHSLASAETFYASLGMHNCGTETCDDEGPFCLFEFDDSGSDAFRQKME